MKKLNNRETETAIVAASFFAKGSPEYRIAKYAFEKQFTDQQFSNFLDKLDCLPEEVKFVIHTHFRDFQKGICTDKSKLYGKRMWDWGMSTPRA